LLVSHWEVASEATVKLITKAIAELKADPKIGRAEALWSSMLSMIDTGKEYETIQRTGRRSCWSAKVEQRIRSQCPQLLA
jgi:CHAT domain-containing protein